MYGEATEKVSGGKLVRVKVNFDNIIHDVQITGDFFLYPEDCIHEIENALKDDPIDLHENTVVEKINDALQKNNAELIGIYPETLSKTLKMAIENGKMATDTS